MSNNQGNFQLHRFIRRDNSTKSFRGSTFCDSHCRNLLFTGKDTSSSVTMKTKK